jgi:hypothetical protein
MANIAQFNKNEDDEEIKFTVTRTTTTEPNKITKTRVEEITIPSDLLASCRNLKELKELKRKFKKR